MPSSFSAEAICGHDAPAWRSATILIRTRPGKPDRSAQPPTSRLLGRERVTGALRDQVAVELRDAGDHRRSPRAACSGRTPPACQARLVDNDATIADPRVEVATDPTVPPNTDRLVRGGGPRRSRAAPVGR
jgi:hypothetical protein